MAGVLCDAVRAWREDEEWEHANPPKQCSDELARASDEWRSQAAVSC